MTREEFLRLPVAERFTYVEINGKRIPKMTPLCVAWLESHEPHGFYDDQGIAWTIAVLNGERVRVRVR